MFLFELCKVPYKKAQPEDGSKDIGRNIYLWNMMRNIF